VIRAHAPILDEPRALSAALLVMLGSEGLRIPGLDAVGGELRHGPLPLALPELLLLAELGHGECTLRVVADAVAHASGASIERLYDVLDLLAERRLLTEPGVRRGLHAVSGPVHVPVDAAAVLDANAVYVVVTPRFFRPTLDGFEHIDHEGRLRARFSTRELAALGEFRRPSTIAEALEAHRAECGVLALEAAAFDELVRRLLVADLLEVSAHDDEVSDSGTALRRGRPTIGRERAADRDWQRFQALNEAMRQDVRACDAAEREHERATGRERVRVVAVQQNGTIAPLALGMIVAAAKAHAGGALNEHYFFHPDWLVRPSKVRALAARPAIYLHSNYNWCHRHNLMVSQKVKQHSPWSLNVHGGPNTPKYEADCEAYFAAHPDVDVTVRGEGEAVVVELLEALAGQIGRGPLDLSVLRDVRGITYRDGQRIVRTPERERIAELDALPSPVLTGLFHAYAGHELMIFESNRGCPYSCTFCDWGSAIGTRIRKFDLARVFAELEWCAQHQVAGIMCADANFGVFERDVEIAAKVAELKAKYGYPNGFSVSAAKNTTKHTKRIIEILADAGVMTKGSIGVQSMDPDTLATVQRSNIKVSKYDELTTEFRKAGLSLWVDLMFGLPGQSVASFQNDLQGCIDRGVFPRMFRTELLVNSPMNEPAYRTRHRIETEPSADGSKNLVVATATFTREQFAEMNSLRLTFLLCDVIGMLRHVAHFVRSRTGLREIDFYERLRRDIQAEPERWPSLSFSVRALLNLLVPPVSWALPLGEARRYLIEALGFADDDALRTVFAVQLAVLPARDRVMPQTLMLAHDYAAWHRAMVTATQTGHHHDWSRVVPDLSSFGPASFLVDDPDKLCALGIGATVDGDLFGNYELRSPVARWVRQVEHLARSQAAPEPASQPSAALLALDAAPRERQADHQPA
jgi:hypothetical protein